MSTLPDLVTITVKCATADCWACGCETTIVSRLVLQRDAKSLECSISDLSGFPDLGRVIQERIPGDIEIGALKLRYSKTRKQEYLSNGCVHCDALFGDHFEIHARYDEYEATRFERSAKEGWDRSFERLSRQQGY